jgi:tetratricopeptide (TPR) repeat protein
VDATAMLLLLSHHMNETAALRQAGPRMRQVAKAGPDASVRLYAGLLAERLGGARDWLKKMEHYLGGEAEDPVLLALCARARLSSGNYRLARQYADRIARAIPGATLFTWFVEAYHNVWLGRRDEWERITAEEIKHHPGNVMLRFALAEGLTETGKLGEAEKALNDAAGLADKHEFLPYMRAELALLRGEYKAACVELRKSLAAVSDDSIGYDYYRLSKIYTLRGDRREAQRHLQIARNLAPEANLKTNEELSALVHGPVEYKPVFEDGRAQCQELNFAKGKETLLKNLYGAYKSRATAESTVYIFGAEQEPQAVRMWLFFDESGRNPQKGAKLFLPALPLSSFVDARGRALKADFTRVQTEYGRYQASLAYAEPLAQYSPYPVEILLNLEGLWHERQGGVIDLRLDEACHSPGWRAHTPALPENSEILEISARADEELKKAGWRFLVFRRFFYDCEHFRLKARIKHKRA